MNPIVWESSPGAVDALLATRSFWACDLYSIQLVGGGVLSYAGGDCDVAANGVRFSCGGMTGPYFELIDTKATIHQKLGTDVDTLVFDVLPGAATVLGMPFLRAVRYRLLHDARVSVYRAYAPFLPAATSWPVPVTGIVGRFSGFLAPTDSGGSSATFTIYSPMRRLQNQWPRNFYMPACNSVVGDHACGVNLAARGVGATASAGATGLTLACGLADADGTYDLGTVKFTSGALAGLSRTVRRWAGGIVTLMTPFPEAPAEGDAFVATPGCDGSLSQQGCPKFANLGAFRGFPFLPAPTTAN